MMARIVVSAVIALAIIGWAYFGILTH